MADTTMDSAGFGDESSEPIRVDYDKTYTVFSKMKGYRSAEKARHGTGESVDVPAGEYYLIEDLADAVHLIDKPLTTDFWINAFKNQMPEPKTVDLVAVLRGYAEPYDASIQNDAGYSQIGPGTVYIFSNSTAYSNVANVAEKRGQYGVWVDLSKNVSPPDPDKYEVFKDMAAYITPEDAYGKTDNCFTIEAGTYFILWYTDDEQLAYLSYLTAPMGPGFYIRVADNTQQYSEVKIKVHLPLNGYHSVEDAMRDEGSDCMKFEAGEYYALAFYENNRVAYISDNPMGPGHYVNLVANEGNLELDTGDGTEGTDPSPSNTGTVSGIDNKPKKKGSLTHKSPEVAYSPGEYVCPPCYVKNLVTGTTIEFRQGMPEGLSDSASASFEPAEIRGRSNQLQGYSSTESRTISFSYEFHEELEPEGLLTLVARIKALEYPGYASVVEPPKCYLRLGNAVRGTFICNSADVSYPENGGTRDDYFLKADVSFSFIETSDFARSAAEIEDGGGMLE